jgi:hypothetical protein
MPEVVGAASWKPDSEVGILRENRARKNGFVNDLNRLVAE